MKKTIIISSLLVLLASSLSAKGKHPDVQIISRSLDIFYFKVAKEMIGAEVEVYTESGEKLIKDTIEHKRTLIDFYYETPGHYIIKIKKGGVEQSFDYCKNTDSPYTPIEGAHVKIAK